MEKKDIFQNTNLDCAASRFFILKMKNFDEFAKSNSMQNIISEIKLNKEDKEEGCKNDKEEYNEKENELKKEDYKENRRAQKEKGFTFYSLDMDRLIYFYFRSGEYNIPKKGRYRVDTFRKNKSISNPIQIITWKDYVVVINPVYIYENDEINASTFVGTFATEDEIEKECKNRNLYNIRNIRYQFDTKPELDDIHSRLEQNSSFPLNGFVSVILDLLKKNSDDNDIFVFNNGSDFVRGNIVSGDDCYGSKALKEQDAPIENDWNDDEIIKDYRFGMFQIDETALEEKEDYYKSLVRDLIPSNTNGRFVFPEGSCTFSTPTSFYLVSPKRDDAVSLGINRYKRYFYSFLETILKRIDLTLRGKEYERKMEQSEEIKKNEVDDISAYSNEVQLFMLNVQQKVVKISPEDMVVLWHQKTGTNFIMKKMETISNQLVDDYKMVRDDTTNWALNSISTITLFSALWDLFSLVVFGMSENSALLKTMEVRAVIKSVIIFIVFPGICFFVFHWKKFNLKKKKNKR